MLSIRKAQLCDEVGIGIFSYTNLLVITNDLLIVFACFQSIHWLLTVNPFYKSDLISIPKPRLDYRNELIIDQPRSVTLKCRIATFESLISKVGTSSY